MPTFFMPTNLFGNDRLQECYIFFFQRDSQRVDKTFNTIFSLCPDCQRWMVLNQWINSDYWAVGVKQCQKAVTRTGFLRSKEKVYNPV